MRLTGQTAWLVTASLMSKFLVGKTEQLSNILISEVNCVQSTFNTTLVVDVIKSLCSLDAFLCPSINLMQRQAETGAQWCQEQYAYQTLERTVSCVKERTYIVLEKGEQKGEGKNI